MEHTQKTDKKYKSYEGFRAHTPRILACCYFLGSLLIGLGVFLGVTAYNGETLSISNCVDWIIDFGNLETEKLAYYSARLILSVLYILYFLRILKQILQSLPSFIWVMKGKGDARSRTQAVFALNKRFGKICGMATMHMVWGYMISSSLSGVGVGLVAGAGIVIFIGTGLLLNYSYEKPSTVSYVVVDTARNLLAALIVLMLLITLKTPALASLYQSLYRVENIIDIAGSGDNQVWKQIVYLIYAQWCVPILSMIFWLSNVSFVKKIVENHNYAQKAPNNYLPRKFKRVCVFASVLIVLDCCVKAICTGSEIHTLFGAALDMYLPIILLSIAGMLLFHFSYPERYALQKALDKPEKEKCESAGEEASKEETVQTKE